MSDDASDIDLSTAKTDAEWMARLDELGEELGYFEPLGQSHAAFFCKGNDTLLVSFETVPEIRALGGDHRPLGYRLAARNGWSSLTLVARTESWFRMPVICDFFDRQVDEAFFDEFETVAFVGAGPCGHAAAAYSVTAPAARVLVIAPQATLTPALAGWDTRYPQARLLDFTSRYGYAPDMAEAAEKVFVIHDPLRRLDAMHATLFSGSQVMRLPARLQGRDTARELTAMDLMAPLVEAAVDASLTPELFNRLMRRRRAHPPFLYQLALRCDSRGKPNMTARAARLALTHVRSRRLTEILQKAEAQLATAPGPG